MQLIFPGFLWAALGIIVPIALHLLQLRRPQRVSFTNTEFIQRIEFTNGRRRLQDLLVLALRVLAVAFIVLAFCQPFIGARVARGNVGSKEVSVFLDTSPSMHIPSNAEGSLVDKASMSSRLLSKNYGVNARLQLVGQPGQRREGDPSTAVAAKPLHASQLGWGAGVVRRELENETGGPLYVFSDFQRSEASAAVFKRLPTTREIILVPQTGLPVANVYVDSVWLNDAFVRVRTNIGMHVRLRNGGVEAAHDCAVRVLVSGQQAAAFRVDVAPAQVVETVVHVQVKDGQLIEGQVVVEDAPVTFDKDYYFTLQPTAAIQVIEIGPVAVAQQAYQHEALFHYSYSKPEQVDFNQLQQANLVLVSEAAIVDAALRAALTAVTKRGGSVVIVPPAARGAQETYTKLLRTLGVGEVQWENPTAEPVRQELAMPDLRSPFFRDVFGAQPRQVTLPEVSPVVRMNGNGTDILRLRDGGAFLTEFGAGPGKVYVFSAPFDRKYSDFTTQALFVPVLYRLAMLSYQDSQPLAYRIGTKSLLLRGVAAQATGKDELAYRLVRDSVTLVPAQRRQGQQLQLELPKELNEPGFYQLRRQGQVVTTLAFNQPKKESELATYSPAEMRQLIGANRPNVRVLDADNSVQALGRYRAEETGRPLWRYCLLLALGCLLAEAIVLRWGRNAQLAKG